MTSPLSIAAASAQPNIHRVAILFAGGPAPAANAVISTAADSFLRNDIEVVGILTATRIWWSSVPTDHAAARETADDYIMLTPRMLRRTRNSQGILDRHGPGQSGQARLASDASERRRASEAARRRSTKRCARSASTR